MSRQSEYGQKIRIVEAAELDVQDGLVFTFSGAEYPPPIANMNGWSVEETAKALSTHKS